MREIINWAGMNAKERVERIIKDVMHRATYANLLSLHLAKRTAGENRGLDYPLAFWDGQVNAWYIFSHAGDEDARPFDPLKSTDDALLLLQLFPDWKLQPLHFQNGPTQYLATILIPIDKRRTRACDGIAASLPEAICFAAFEARGFHLEKSE
jgi:hypothetical protein